MTKAEKQYTEKDYFSPVHGSFWEPSSWVGMVVLTHKQAFGRPRHEDCSWRTAQTTEWDPLSIVMAVTVGANEKIKEEDKEQWSYGPD